jgi:hypothetical protein
VLLNRASTLDFVGPFPMASRGESPLDTTGSPPLIYLENVGDTRYSGSELIVRKLVEQGADVCVHDPYMEHRYELENQDGCPAKGQSRSRLFENQTAFTKICFVNISALS